MGNISTPSARNGPVNQLKEGQIFVFAPANAPALVHSLLCGRRWKSAETVLLGMKFKTSKKPINNAAPFSFPHPPAQHHLQLLMALKRGGSILNPAGSESGRDVSYVKRAEERGCVNWQSTDTGSSDRMRSVAVVVCTQQNTVVSNSECCLLSLMLSEDGRYYWFAQQSNILIGSAKIWFCELKKLS